MDADLEDATQMRRYDAVVRADRAGHATAPCPCMWGHRHLPATHITTRRRHPRPRTDSPVVELWKSNAFLVGFNRDGGLTNEPDPARQVAAAPNWGSLTPTPRCPAHVDGLAIARNLSCDDDGVAADVFSTSRGRVLNNVDDLVSAHRIASSSLAAVQCKATARGGPGRAHYAPNDLRRRREPHERATTEGMVFL